jgi:hypothetical protein
MAGRNKAGNEGDVRAIQKGDGRRKNILFTVSWALDCEVCVLR